MKALQLNSTQSMEWIYRAVVSVLGIAVLSIQLYLFYGWVRSDSGDISEKNLCVLFCLASLMSLLFTWSLQKLSWYHTEQLMYQWIQRYARAPLSLLLSLNEQKLINLLENSIKNWLRPRVTLLSWLSLEIVMAASSCCVLLHLWPLSEAMITIGAGVFVAFLMPTTQDEAGFSDKETESKVHPFFLPSIARHVYLQDGSKALSQWWASHIKKADSLTADWFLYQTLAFLAIGLIHLTPLIDPYVPFAQFIILTFAAFWIGFHVSRSIQLWKLYCFKMRHAGDSYYELRDFVKIMRRISVPQTKVGTQPHFNQGLALYNVTVNAGEVLLEVPALQIPCGSIFGVLCPEAMQSQLLVNLLIGTQPYIQGEILIDTQNWYSQLPLWRKKCGLVSSHSLFFPDKSLEENITLNNACSKSSVTEIKNQVGLQNFKDRAENLSSPYLDTIKLRLSLARALLNNARFVIVSLGEGNISEEEELKIIEPLLTNLQGRTVVLIGNSVPMVQYCEHLTMVKENAWITIGDYHDLVRHQNQAL